MNRIACCNCSVLAIICNLGLVACGGGGGTNVVQVETIVATSGSGQSAVISTGFVEQLVAKVSTNGTPDSGVVVTFTAPSSGASGIFGSVATGTATATATTDASGIATSPAFIANATVGGPYIVTAAVAGATTPADFTETNTAVGVISGKFSFYLSGLEAVNNFEGPNYYALAGSVTIDSSGTVLGGEQDYNDANGFTFLGDTITGGLLVEDAAAGQGTLTLTIANNTMVGVNGTETLGVQFVNANHALLMQFDGSATSSGSMDLQTLPSTLTGGFAFTLSGIGPAPNNDSIVTGGVFSISDGSLKTGMFDIDDNGVATAGTAITGGTIFPADSFGRGTITVTSTGTTLPATIVYYVVGPEAIRLIDMDASDSAVGSAFGQGSAAGGFTNASLGPSVFGIQSNSSPGANPYAAVGMFTTSVADVSPVARPEGTPAANNFSGVADGDELEDIISTGSAISGTYTIGANGYGNLSITNSGLGDGDIETLGIYMVDPNININDPNNTSIGGGALVADLDTVLNGTGVILPQPNTMNGFSFSGNYAFGAQVFNSGGEGTGGWEVDFAGQGNVTPDTLALTGVGFLSDPFFTLTTSATDSGVAFTGTAVADAENVGRYTMFDPAPLVVTLNSTSPSYQVALYQAAGGELLWIEEDNLSLFGGSLQQLSLPTPTEKMKRQQ